MAGKKHLRMRGVKTASKRQQDDILGRAKELAENPSVLRPLCAGGCRKCIFDKVFKDIDKISRYRGDEKTLIKLASKGFDDLAKAYAGTISVDAAGNIPLLATAVIAGERVPYVVRGSVSNALLIGCQHYDDARLRLLYYNGLIKKAGMHLYSWDEGLVCSDKPNMPEDYLYDAWWDTPYKFPEDDTDCGHKGAVSLNIRVKSLDQTIHICEDCAKDVSTIAFLVSKVCAANPLDDFDVTVEHKYHAANESGSVEITGDVLMQYMRGQITDRALIDRTRREKLGELSKSGATALIIGEENYGSDLDRFMNDVEGPENEKKALLAFLSDNPRALVLRNGRTAEIISSLWDDDWKGLIGAFTSPDFASRTFTEKPRQTPSDVIADAVRAFISEDVVKSLPAFTKMGYMTQIADTLAKSAKVGGIMMVEESAARLSTKDSKSKALVASFYYVFDRNANVHLNMSKEDLSFAEFLIPFAKKVIDADGKNYRDEMNTLLMACSSGESV